MWKISKLDQHDWRLSRLERKVKHIMSTLQEIVDEVAMEATVITSLVVFVHGLQDQIAHAVPSLTSEQQGQINMVFAAVHANKEAIAAAMTANVPAAPAVTEVPAGVVEVPMM